LFIAVIVDGFEPSAPAVPVVALVPAAVPLADVPPEIPAAVVFVFVPFVVDAPAVPAVPAVPMVVAELPDMPIGVWFMLGLVLGFVVELLLLVAAPDVVAPGVVAAAFGPFGLMIGDDVGFGFGLEFGFGDGAAMTPVLLSVLEFCTGVPVGVVVVLELVLPPVLLPVVPPLDPLVCANAPHDNAVAHSSAISRT